MFLYISADSGCSEGGAPRDFDGLGKNEKRVPKYLDISKTFRTFAVLKKKRHNYETNNLHSNLCFLRKC